MKIPFRGAVRGSWARPAGARNLNCHGQQTVVRSAESGMEAEVRESSGAQKENGCGSGWVPDRTRGCLRSGWLVHTRPCEVFQPCHDWRQRPKYMTQGMAAFRSQRRGRLRPTGVGGGGTIWFLWGAIREWDVNCSLQNELKLCFVRLPLSYFKWLI